MIQSRKDISNSWQSFWRSPRQVSIKTYRIVAQKSTGVCKEAQRLGTSVSMGIGNLGKEHAHQE